MAKEAVAPSRRDQRGSSPECVAERYLATTIAQALEVPPKRDRVTRSAAAVGHSGKSKRKPASMSRRGMTRRLFKISSVSVRWKNAAISNIHLVAGKPIRAPQAARSAAMNAAWGSGQGEARLT